MFFLQYIVSLSLYITKKLTHTTAYDHASVRCYGAYDNHASFEMLVVLVFDFENLGHWLRLRFSAPATPNQG
jgi:hypothetical protein